MSTPRDLALLFLRKAREDESIVLDLPPNAFVPEPIFGFHAQQVAEKLLKAALSIRAIPFRRTHQLRELMDALTDGGTPLPSALSELDQLSPFAVELRYDDVPVGEIVDLDRESVRSWLRTLRTWVEASL
jgi:HEPN domain-containing protein